MKIILSVFVAFFAFTSMAFGQMFTEKQRKFEYTLSLDEPANMQIDFQFPTLKKLPNYNPYMSKPSLYITGEDPGRDSRSDHNFLRHTYENIINNDLTRLNLPLKAGRYHVILQYPNNKQYLNLPFDFKMTKVKGAFEQEPNNGWGTANLLIEDEVYTGYMQMKDGGNDSDFFELVVEESGILELSFTTAEKPINGRPYFGNHEIYFYDGSLALPNERMNHVMMQQKPAKGEVKKSLALKKGHYFVQVKHVGNNGVVNQKYTIGYTFTPTQRTDTHAIDTTDPEQVAFAFIKAVAKKDIDSALMLVVPDERDKARKDLPPLLPWPYEPRIKMMIENNTCQVIIENFDEPAGMDMKLIENRWWVVQ